MGYYTHQFPALIARALFRRLCLILRQWKINTVESDTLESKSPQVCPWI